MWEVGGDGRGKKVKRMGKLRGDGDGDVLSVEGAFGAFGFGCVCDLGTGLNWCLGLESRLERGKGKGFGLAVVCWIGEEAYAVISWGEMVTTLYR